LLVPQPLANFALTRRTFRSTDYAGWGQSQALLGAAFLQQVPMTAGAKRQLWAYRRSLRPRSCNSLFFAALLARDLGFLVHARTSDWLRFLAGCIRHPRVTWAVLQAKHQNSDCWPFLLRITANRTSEARMLGFTVLEAGGLLDKHQPLIGS